MNCLIRLRYMNRGGAGDAQADLCCQAEQSETRTSQRSDQQGKKFGTGTIEGANIVACGYRKAWIGVERRPDFGGARDVPGHVFSGSPQFRDRRIGRGADP